MAEIGEWTLVQETDVPRDIQARFVAGETAEKAYKTLRDKAVFTNKRLIIQDVQGISGRKKETYSIPYSSVIMWSVENSGLLDMSAEVQLWTRLGSLKINLQRGIDVDQFDRLLAEAIL